MNINANAPIQFGMRKRVQDIGEVHSMAAEWAQKNQRPAASLRSPNGSAYVVTGPELSDALAARVQRDEMGWRGDLFELYAPKQQRDPQKSQEADLWVTDNLTVSDLKWAQGQEKEPRRKSLVDFLLRLAQSPQSITAAEKRDVFGDK